MQVLGNAFDCVSVKHENRLERKKKEGKRKAMTIQFRMDVWIVEC